MANSQNIWSHLRAVKKTIVLILAPLSLLPLVLLLDSKDARCAYGTALMVVYWLTEALPWPLAALLPLLVFPLLGVSAVSNVSRHYMKDSSLMVMGFLTLAVAMEHCGLDRRLALSILRRTGLAPIWLMLGFMGVSWLLSLLMEKTAAAAVVLPVVMAVLRQLRDTKVKRSPSLLARQVVQRALSTRPAVTGGQWRAILSPHRHPKRGSKAEADDEMTEIMTGEDCLDTKLSPATPRATHRRLCKGLSLCVAVAVNIGCIGTLSNTSPNLVTHDQAQKLFHNLGLESTVTFTNWLVFALPVSILCLLLAWLWLSLFFFGPKQWRKKTRGDKVKEALVKETLLRHYHELGPISFAEKAVMGHCLLLFVCLLTMDPPLVPGWSSLFPRGFVGSSTVAVLVALCLFVFPAQRPRAFCWRHGSLRARSVSAVLDWRSMQASFPWGVLLLLGGGHAVAHVWSESDLTARLTEELGSQEILAPWTLCLVLSAVLSVMTQLTGGAAAAAPFLTSHLAQMALDRQVNPLYFLIPCAIATSFTFLLPMATPPNALVFATGHLVVKDMVLAGSVVNVVCVLVVSMAINTWGTAYFHLNTLPPQFFTPALNATASTSLFHWASVVVTETLAASQPAVGLSTVDSIERNSVLNWTRAV